LDFGLGAGAGSVAVAAAPLHSSAIVAGAFALAFRFFRPARRLFGYRRGRRLCRCCRRAPPLIGFRVYGFGL
jgi:hypothetical protein